MALSKLSVKVNTNDNITASSDLRPDQLPGHLKRALQNFGYYCQHPGNAGPWLADLGRLVLLGLVNSFGQISPAFGIGSNALTVAERYLETANSIVLVPFEKRYVGGTNDLGLESLLAIAGSEPKQIVDTTLGRLAILENGNHILYANKAAGLEQACGALANEELRHEILNSIPEIEDTFIDQFARSLSNAYNTVASRAPISWLAWLLQMFGVSHGVMESAENYVRNESQSQLGHILNVEEQLGRGEQIGGLRQSLGRKTEVAQMAAESPQGESAARAYIKLQSLLKSYWHKIVDNCGQGKPVRNEAEKLAASFLLLDYLDGLQRQETMKVDLARALYLRELSEDDKAILSETGNGNDNIIPQKYLEEQMALHMAMYTPASIAARAISQVTEKFSTMRSIESNLEKLQKIADIEKGEAERYLRAQSALENLQQVEEGVQSQVLEKRLGVLADTRNGLIDGFVYSVTPEQYTKAKKFIGGAVDTFKKQAGFSLRPTFVSLSYRPRATGSQNYAPLGLEDAELMVGRPYAKNGVITTQYQKIPVPRNLYRAMNAVMLDCITGPAGTHEISTIMPWELTFTGTLDTVNELNQTNMPENTETLKSKA